MLLKTTAIPSSPLISAAAAAAAAKPQISLAFLRPSTLRRNPPTPARMSLPIKLGTRLDVGAAASSVAQGPDDDIPGPGQEFAQFGAGCFWGVELAYQRVPGVTKTEVGYTQGYLHDPSYEDICSGTTNHSEVVRVQFDPKPSWMSSGPGMTRPLSIARGMMWEHSTDLGYITTRVSKRRQQLSQETDNKSFLTIR